MNIRGGSAIDNVFKYMDRFFSSTVISKSGMAWLLLLMVICGADTCLGSSYYRLAREYDAILHDTSKVKSGEISVKEFEQKYGNGDSLGPAIEAIFEQWQRNIKNTEKRDFSTTLLQDYQEPQILDPGPFGVYLQDSYYLDLVVEIKKEKGISCKEEAYLIGQIPLLQELHTHLQKAERDPLYLVSQKELICAARYNHALHSLQKHRKAYLETRRDRNELSVYDISRYQLEKKYGVEISDVLSDRYVSNYVKAKRFQRSWALNDDILAQLSDDMGKLTFGGLFIMGALYAAPESVSGWSDSQKESSDLHELARKHNENTSSGPVLDSDDLWLNAVAHPVSGAWYYVFARKYRGLNPFQSFVFATFLSSFWWEFGIEAFAEAPSAQDLYITPVFGSLVGEIFYQIDGYIERNGGEVAGSVWAGKTVQFLLNPLQALVVGLDTLGRTLHINIGGEIIWQQQYDRDYDLMDSIIGFRVVLSPQP